LVSVAAFSAYRSTLYEIGCFAQTKVGGGFDFTEKPKLRFGEPSVADFF
jgi:hypothetical protein